MRTFGFISAAVGIILLLVVLSFGVRSCSIAQEHAYKSMENAVISYDEYQDIYNTCLKIDMDLKAVKEMDASDPSFENFSKAQRINALRSNLNRWITDYNAKSYHIDKKLWKSSSLPQTLSTNDFLNY